MYDYTAQNDDELAFSKGQLISVLSKEDPDWWKGEAGGHVGLFPSNYVKLTTDTDPSQQCKCGARPLLAPRGRTCSIALTPPGVQRRRGPSSAVSLKTFCRADLPCGVAFIFYSFRNMSRPSPPPFSFF